MHFPIEVHFADNKLPLHAIMETAGFFLGFRYFLFLRKKQGDLIESKNRIWILIATIFGGLIGSRLVGSLERPYELFLTNNIWEYIYNNKTVLGGFLGGLWMVEVVKKILNEKHSSGDLFAYPIILALIIGRIGCFSMGIFEETYGVETVLFTGMNLGDGLLRHPVTLYEICFLVFLWIGMIHFEKKYVPAEGGRFKIFMIAYILFRLLQDFIKPSYIIVAGLSTIQLTAIAGLLYYYKYLLHPKKLLVSHA
ncbi:MAG: prolipoprotein diacylglyceryl transferase [Gloeobacteraceae cyanobacterium ES-bin-316]|nr:prolipoprotein diacylglyceryl transferase [Ferruginibacter sp.]